jgi:hypothetical protein
MLNVRKLNRFRLLCRDFAQQMQDTVESLPRSVVIGVIILRCNLRQL